MSYPFHTVAQRVHHRHHGCGSGRSITPDQIRAGTGGKELCPECADLAKRETVQVGPQSPGLAPHYRQRSRTQSKGG
jgi:hypothetical protein